MLAALDDRVFELGKRLLLVALELLTDNEKEPTATAGPDATPMPTNVSCGS